MHRAEKDENVFMRRTIVEPLLFMVTLNWYFMALLLSLYVPIIPDCSQSVKSIVGIPNKSLYRRDNTTLTPIRKSLTDEGDFSLLVFFMPQLYQKDYTLSSQLKGYLT